MRKVKELPAFTPAAATRLLTALKDSHYSEDGKQLIAAAIDESVISSPVPSGVTRPKPASGKRSRSRSVYQYLHSAMTSYLTGQDWDGLRCAQRPLANKVQVIVDRLVRLGVRSPDEHTIAWGVGIVMLCHFTTYPMYQTVKANVDSMKQSIQCCQREWPFDFIQEYLTFINLMHMSNAHSCNASCVCSSAISKGPAMFMPMLLAFIYAPFTC